MTVYTYFIVGCLAMPIAVGCRSTRVDKDNSQASQGPVWQQRPLLIDGSDADWAKPLPFYDKKEGLHYSISNDKDNLYIMISARSPEEQQKIIEGGLTVWINTDAQKDNSNAVGIGYPTGRKPSRESAIMAEARPDQVQEKGHTLKDDLSAYVLYDFDKDSTVQNFDAGDSNQSGVQVIIGFNSISELVYEALVPLASIYPQNSSHNFAGKSFAVGIYVEGLPPGEGAGRRGGRSPVSFGGDFGTGSFGTGAGIGISIGGGGWGGHNGESQLFEQTRIWQVVSVARPGSVH